MYTFHLHVNQLNQTLDWVVSTPDTCMPANHAVDCCQQKLCKFITKMTSLASDMAMPHFFFFFIKGSTLTTMDHSWNVTTTSIIWNSNVLMFKQILHTTAIRNMWNTEKNMLFDPWVKRFNRVAVKWASTDDILYFLFSKLFYLFYLEKCV